MRAHVFSTSCIFFFGVAVSALPVNALSVYVFHDVDKNRMGQWNRAFGELMVEFLLFSTITALFLLVFLALGRRFIRPSVSEFHPGLSFLLGCGLLVFQYIFDILVRVFIPSMYDLMLGTYLLIGPAFCAAILLRSGTQRAQPSHAP